LQLPFTSDEFFSVFAEYNRVFWPVAIVWWLATIASLVLVWRQPERWSAAVSVFLAGLWFWNAGAYHALLFTRINPAAWIFAGLFALEALLLVRAGLHKQLVYLSAPTARQTLGLGLATYSLAYPFLTIALGHQYPRTPTFGVPCPTVILTIGLLLSVRERAPLNIAAVPIVWAFIGGSAATLLRVPADYMLLVSGLILLIVNLAPAAVRLTTYTKARSLAHRVNRLS
jgi:hypothetical protein